jgi:toxin ParE1/3/4
MSANRNELVWAPEARRDLVEIWNYFTAVASSEVAETLLRDIDKASARLLRHPLSGRPRDDIAPSLRSVIVRPYVILYRQREPNIEIVRILHMRRNFAAALLDKA